MSSHPAPIGWIRANGLGVTLAGRCASVSQCEPRAPPWIIGAVEALCILHRLIERWPADQDGGEMVGLLRADEPVAPACEDATRVGRQRTRFDRDFVGQPLVVEARRVD